MLYHSHNLTKQAAYYLEAPPLPPEDLEPPPEKIEEKPVETIEPKNATNDFGVRKKVAGKRKRGGHNSRITTGPGHSPYMVRVQNRSCSGPRRPPQADLPLGYPPFSADPPPTGLIPPHTLADLTHAPRVGVITLGFGLQTLPLG